MTYQELFAKSGITSSVKSGVEVGALSTELQLADALMDKLNNLGLAEQRLVEQTTLMGDVLEAYETDKSSGAGKMLFAVIDSVSNGNGFAVLGTSMEDISEDAFSMEALGGIKDAISRGYDIVIEFIKKLIRESKVFIGAFFDKFPGLKKRAAKIRTKAEGIEGSIDEKKIKIGGAYKALTNGSKVVENVADGLKTINGLKELSGIEKIPAWLSEQRLESFEGDAATIRAITVNNLKDNGDSIFSKQGMTEIATPKSAALANYDKVVGVEDLLGDKTCAWCRTTHLDEQGTGSVELTLKSIASIKFGFYDQSTKLDVADKEAPTLESADVEKICDNVTEICETFGRSKDEIREGIKVQEKMVKTLEKIKKNVDKEDYKEVKSRLNALKSAVQNLANMATNPASKIAVYAYGTSVAALDYSEKSLAQYKK